jgi:hypothetical protein
VENAERVWRGLAAFGAPLDELGIQRDDLCRSGTVIQLGLPPNRIDLLTGISGVPDFEAAWAERAEHVFGGPPGGEWTSRIWRRWGSPRGLKPPSSPTGEVKPAG